MQKILPRIWNLSNVLCDFVKKKPYSHLSSLFNIELRSYWYEARSGIFHLSETSAEWWISFSKNKLFICKRFLRGWPIKTGLLFRLASVCFYYYSVKKCNLSYKVKHCRILLVIQSGSKNKKNEINNENNINTGIQANWDEKNLAQTGHFS